MKSVRDRKAREFRLKRIRGMDDKLKDAQHKAAKKQNDWYGYCPACGGRMIGNPNELLKMACTYCGDKP